MWPHEGFTTRVFTNEPVSMKYRGVFELSARDEQATSMHRFKLTYQSRRTAQKWPSTMHEALLRWLKKYGKNLVPNLTA